MDINNVRLVPTVLVDYEKLLANQSSGIFKFDGKNYTVHSAVGKDDFNSFLKESTRREIVKMINLNRYEDACSLISQFFERFGKTLDISEVVGVKLGKMREKCPNLGTEVVCQNLTDPISLEEYDSNTVYNDSDYVIILEDTLSEKGYCYDKDMLIQSMKHSVVFAPFPQKDRSYYKLPNPDIWIDDRGLNAIFDAKKMVIKKILYNGKPRIEKLGKGSSLEVGTLHGRELPVYTLDALEVNEKEEREPIVYSDVEEPDDEYSDDEELPFIDNMTIYTQSDLNVIPKALYNNLVLNSTRAPQDDEIDDISHIMYEDVQVQFLTLFGTSIRSLDVGGDENNVVDILIHNNKYPITIQNIEDRNITFRLSHATLEKSTMNTYIYDISGLYINPGGNPDDVLEALGKKDNYRLKVLSIIDTQLTTEEVMTILYRLRNLRYADITGPNIDQDQLGEHFETNNISRIE